MKLSDLKIKGLAVAAALLLYSALAGAQDKNIPKEYYQATTIPDSLKQDANAVARYQSKEITVKAPGRIAIKSRSIITVLNEKGDYHGEIGMMYNRKFDTYGSIEIRVYNANGQQVKKYTKSDMYEHSATDEETIATDDRVLLLQHTIPSYPATIDIAYEEYVTSFTGMPGWTVRVDPEIAIQNSVCKVMVAPEVGFRYKAANIAIQPEKGRADNYETYTWQVKNLKASKPEEDVLPWQRRQHLMFSTNKFEYYGMPGELDSWQNFGKWIARLNTDVNTLSPERTAQIKAMTDTIKSDKDKARFLYRYLQQNMRYVSVQLGIGGLKPFPAMFVDQKRYGDCKALTNYMYALLKAAGVPSYYAIINAGENAEPADPAFPDNVFNHVILCVPFNADTTWLECTSITQPFGRLGSFTENRRALLITEDGGKLVNTPRSTMADNKFDSQVHLILNADGSAKAQVTIKSTGDYRSLYLGIASGKVDEQKEFYIRSLNMKQPIAFELRPPADAGGLREIGIDLEFDKFCDVNAGPRQFYRPAVFDLWRLTLPELEKRRADFYFDHPMQKSCTTTIDLPAGYEVEALPAASDLKFSYGSFKTSYKYDAAKNQVIGTVNFNLTDQMVPAAKYTELQQYFDAIAKAQNKKLVIKRKG